MLHIRLATVSFDRGIAFNFAALVSSSIIDTMSSAAGRMSCSAIVCVFLDCAILYATLYTVRNRGTVGVHFCPPRYNLH